MSETYSVLTFCAHYLPGFKYGGPIQSVANLVAHLGKDFSFRIITLDRDHGDSERFPGVSIGKWVRVGDAEVLYLRPSDHSLRTIVRHMRNTPHHAVYLNSFFHFRSTILPLLAQRLGLAPRRPVLLAPRGEFSPGALSLKAKKKRNYIAITKRLNFYRDVTWKASTPYEADDIRTVMGPETKIHIASDLPRPAASELAHVPRVAAQPLRILFLSRISPMKNLEFALQALALVRVPVDFSIVGPVSDPAYWNECKRLIADLPDHVSAKYLGEVTPAEVQSVMARNDLFFLPTLGENFGHVIIEALGAGTPVLVSDRTPWQDFEDAGCGWVESLGNPCVFADRIEAASKQPAHVAASSRHAALAYARIFTEKSAVIEDNRKLFDEALRGSR